MPLPDDDDLVGRRRPRTNPITTDAPAPAVADTSTPPQGGDPAAAQPAANLTMVGFAALQEPTPSRPPARDLAAEANEEFEFLKAITAQIFTGSYSDFREHYAMPDRVALQQRLTALRNNALLSAAKRSEVADWLVQLRFFGDCMTLDEVVTLDPVHPQGHEIYLDPSVMEVLQDENLEALLTKFEGQEPYFGDIYGPPGEDVAKAILKNLRVEKALRERVANPPQALAEDDLDPMPSVVVDDPGDRNGDTTRTMRAADLFQPPVQAPPAGEEEVPCPSCGRRHSTLTGLAYCLTCGTQLRRPVTTQLGFDDPRSPDLRGPSMPPQPIPPAERTVAGSRFPAPATPPQTARPFSDTDSPEQVPTQKSVKKAAAPKQPEESKESGTPTWVIVLTVLVGIGATIVVGSMMLSTHRNTTSRARVVTTRPTPPRPQPAAPLQEPPAPEAPPPPTNPDPGPAAEAPEPPQPQEAACLTRGPNLVAGECCVRTGTQFGDRARHFRRDPSYAGQGHFVCRDRPARQNHDGTLDVSSCNWCEPSSP